MKQNDLTFNILNFEHIEEQLTFYFYKEEKTDTTRFHHTKVPAEVIDYFGEQEHYYCSFKESQNNALAITKKTTPDFEEITDKNGDAKRKLIYNSAFSLSIIKRYYNTKIFNYFSDLGYLIKPNFIHDIEIWIPKKNQDDIYKYYEKFTLRVQIAKITKKPELLISSDGISKSFKESAFKLLEQVPPATFNWVIHNNKLHKYEDAPDEVKQDLENTYPIWNFDLREALNQNTERPPKANKYKTFKRNIENFKKHILFKNGFQEVLPIKESFIPVKKIKVNSVKKDSNLLLFKGKKPMLIPFIGMQYGPFKPSTYSKIQFFFIMHKDHIHAGKLMNHYFTHGHKSFPGLYKFVNIPYHTEDNFSIVFNNKNNPLPEIEEKLIKRYFQKDVHYFAIYISPHSKNSKNKSIKSVYYKVKETLLKRDITSQVIFSEYINESYSNPEARFDYSLNNIAVAVLAKLDGIPWQLDTNLKQELIVGVGAFRHVDTDVQYLGSAFSFTNNGKFNQFECFQKDQTDELAGSILDQIQEYVAVNSNISRLIIHFYKNMSRAELQPIEQGLNSLDLDIPVFIISINKTESSDIVAFDNNSPELMPISGTYINISHNQYLLFNNVRYNEDSKVGKIDGHPFPIKLTINCSQKEELNDPKTIRELINQVYQFSRMYWKSVRQQNLPVTIKYPEMVAEIFPHFSGNEIPNFGKDNLWFL